MLLTTDTHQQLDKLWRSISINNLDIVYRNFNALSGDLFQLLLNALGENGFFEIGTYEETQTKVSHNFYSVISEHTLAIARPSKGAVITLDVYATDKQLNLKMDKDMNLSLELILGDYPRPGQQFLKTFSRSEMDLVPQGLFRLMQNVTLTMEEVIVSRHYLN